jgi:hypothetical protein
MQLDRVPRALQARLGDDATVALLELLDASHREARAPLIDACTERFERRLVEEVAGLRVQNAESSATLRQEMVTMTAALRQEIVTMAATLRQEMATMRAELRQEIAAGRVELIKWSFLFWIGQVLAITAIMGVMLRVMR